MKIQSYGISFDMYNRNKQAYLKLCLFLIIYCSVEIQHFTINGLSPGSPYIIYVTASLGNGKSFPYQSLKIKTSSNCKRKYHMVQHETVVEEESMHMTNSDEWEEQHNVIEDQ